MQACIIYGFRLCALGKVGNSSGARAAHLKPSRWPLVKAAAQEKLAAHKNLKRSDGRYGAGAGPGRQVNTHFFRIRFPDQKIVTAGLTGFSRD